MLNNKQLYRSLSYSPAMMLGISPLYSHAKITVLQQHPEAGNPLSRLSLTAGGSIRPQLNIMSGKGDKGSYKRNGFDGGIRFNLMADYYLFDDIHWINYCELGVNIPAALNWDNHYAGDANDTSRRMLYTGLISKTWGELTFGKQNSVYYDVVGAKTDIWDYDMRAQAPGNGINGDYDGSYRSRYMFKYKNTFGNADIYAGWLLPDRTYHAGNGFDYKRKSGVALGIDYHLTDDLTWGLAWNLTRATITHNLRDAKNYNQSITGNALSWTPGQWTLSAGGGLYNNYLPTKSNQPDHYFAGNGWGIEYFAGYNPVRTIRA